MGDVKRVARQIHLQLGGKGEFVASSRWVANFKVRKGIHIHHSQTLCNEGLDHLSSSETCHTNDISPKSGEWIVLIF